MDRGEIDYVLLRRRPGVLDVILRDLMTTVSPLRPVEPAETEDA
jgi:hypothetical protein